jgi:hypothetical protein
LSVVGDARGQIRLKLMVNGQHICDYVCDFAVKYADGRRELVGQELLDRRVKFCGVGRVQIDHDTQLALRPRVRRVTAEGATIRAWAHA